MAFKLTKSEEQERGALIMKLRDQLTVLDEEVGKFNEAVTELKGPIEVLIQEYNDTLAEARLFCERIAEDRESDFDLKSEKWQEGDRGEAARNWIDEWQNLSFEDFEIDFPDELSVDTPEDADTLEALPDTAEE